MKVKTRKITLTCIFSALATLTFMLENLFPPLIIPGARMGLSNLFILLATICVGYGYGFTTLIVKCLIGSLYSGNISTIAYSLPAGVVSLAIEVLILSRSKKTTILAISTLGAVINSIVQNLTFCVITKTYEYLIYLPYLTLIAIISGLLVGYIVHLLIKKLPSKSFGITN